MTAEVIPFDLNHPWRGGAGTNHLARSLQLTPAEAEAEGERYSRSAAALRARPDLECFAAIAKLHEQRAVLYFMAAMIGERRRNGGRAS